MTTCVLESHAVYGFDLDNQSLVIQDIDVVKSDAPLEIPQTFKVKVISANTVGKPLACLRILPRGLGTTEERIGKATPVPSETAEAVIQQGKICVNVHRPLHLNPETPIALVASYKVDLRGQGKGTSLLHAGAMQPSDLEGVKSWLQFREVVKRVRLFAFSSRRSFTVRIFNGSAPESYPKLLSCDPKTHRFLHDLEFRHSDNGSMRAFYFAVYIEMSAEDRMVNSVMPDMETIMWESSSKR